MLGRAIWTPFALGFLCACGASSRSGESRGNGTKEGGTSGAAGSSTGGSSGPGGGAGIGGSGGSAGDAGSGGSGGGVVDPSVSSSWTWEECGRIAGDSERGPRAVAASPDSSFAITTGDGRVLIYDYDFTLPPAALHGSVDDPPSGLGYSRDGELLAEARDSTVIWDVTVAAIVSEHTAPNTGCRGTRLTFSDDEVVLRYGDDDGCIFSTSGGPTGGGELLGHSPGFSSAAFRGNTIVGTGCSENPAELCVYDLATSALSHIVLSAPAPTTPPSVAPIGDAVVGVVGTQVVVWEPTDGSVRWSAAIEKEFAPPVFTPDGERVVAGDTLYDVADGTPALQARRIANAVALIGSGPLVLTSRPAVFDVSGGSHRVFASNSGPIASLDLSGDGSVLAANATAETFGWRVADDFSSSSAIWSVVGEGAVNVDVSSDARWTAISGDVRFAIDAANGRMAWRDDAFPPSAFVACIGGELRFSPDGSLLAGKRYDTTLDVFDATRLSGGLDAPPPPELLTRLPTSGCGQGVAFSADGSELATPEATFPTSNFPPPVEPGMEGNGILDSTRTFIEASPSGGSYIVTVCTSDEGCRSSLGSRGLAGLASSEGGRHPRFSSEGHWVVAAGKLQHLPTDAVRTYDENATEALFARNGDIIAGERDGSLVRFCRRN